MTASYLHRLERLASVLAEHVMAATAALVGLILLLAASLLWQIHQVRADLEHVTRERVLKLQAITDLLEAAYNRHVTLVNITLIRDPFERDEHAMLFHRHGHAVGKARNDFRALPLDAFEQANMKAQDRLIQDILVRQDRALDLAEMDDMAAAQALMAGELRVLDGRYDQVIQALRRYEAQRIAAASAQTRARVDAAIRHSLILALGAIALALAISYSVHRLLRQRARQLAENLDALRLSGERLQHEANHDPLTQLANRTLFCQRVGEAIARARGTGQELGLLYLDMDRFKPVNDTYGHGVGDQLLQVVAQRLNASVRQSDLVARLGGDEFAILLANLHGGDDPRRLGEVILERVASPVSLAGSMLHPQVSMGLALYPRDGTDVEALLKAADQAMFAVKRQRRQGAG